MNQKNVEIEYLRAVAIIMTLFTHLSFLLPDHNAFLMKLFSIFMPWTGVDLFFCISGFVVAKNYFSMLEKHKSQHQDWAVTQIFWIRRIYRLLPTAWAWAFIPLVLSVAFNRSGIFGSWYDNLKSITAIITFSGNLANQYNMTLGPNSVYWSLALEEQFYFVLPFFLYFVKRPAARVGILALLIIIQFPLDRNMFASPTAAMLSSFRVDAFVWGILIYLFSTKSEYKSFEPVFLENSRYIKILLPALLIYLLGAIPGQMIAMPIAIGMVAIVSAFLVFIASYNKGYLSLVSPVSGVAEWIGSRSYGIYVIHIPAYRIVRELLFRFDFLQQQWSPYALLVGSLVLAFVLIAALAELNFRFIETPLRKRGADMAEKRLKYLTSQNTATA